MVHGLSCSAACGIIKQFQHGVRIGSSCNKEENWLFLARDQTHVPCIRRQILNHWTTREVPTTSFEPIALHEFTQVECSRDSSPPQVHIGSAAHGSDCLVIMR